MASVFSKIISGEIPSYRIYEDDFVYAFLDINPIQPGHTLVVPKIEIDKIEDLPEPHYSALFAAAKKIAVAMQDSLEIERVCTLVHGFDVPHAHYHIIPTRDRHDVYAKPHQASEEELLTYQKRIVTALS